MHLSSKDLIDLLHKNSSEEIVEKYKRYFKPDDIAQDWFLGLKLPTIRTCIKNFTALPLEQVQDLLESPYHEIRMAGLLILVKKSNKKSRAEIAHFYLEHLNAVNAWDLVDASASEILGNYIVESKRTELLEELAEHPSRWYKRVALVACFALVKKKELDWPLNLSKKLSTCKEDMVIKANGWLLRHMIKKGFKKEVMSHLKKYSEQYVKKVKSIAFQDLPKEERLDY